MKQLLGVLMIVALLILAVAFAVWLQRQSPNEADLDTFELITVSEDANTMHVPSRTPRLKDVAPKPQEIQEPRDIALDSRPIIVAGRVATNSSKAREIFVVCRFRRPRGGRRRSSSTVLTCDKSGRFILRGQCESSVVNLKLAGEELFSQTTVVPVGTEDVVIRATRWSTIRAKITFQGNVRPQDLWVSLTNPTSSVRQVFELAFDGSIHERVKPGNYSLEISRDSAKDRVLLRRDNLQVTEGESLDLGRVFLGVEFLDIEVSISLDKADDGDGEKFAFIRAYEPGSTNLITQVTFDYLGEPIPIRVDCLPVDIEVFKPGYKTIKKIVAKDKTHFDLERGRPVELKIIGLEQIDFQKWYVTLFVHKSKDNLTTSQHRVTDAKKAITVYVADNARCSYSIRIGPMIESAPGGMVRIDSTRVGTMPMAAPSDVVEILINKKSVREITEMLAK